MIFNFRAVISGLRRCIIDRRGSTALTFALASPVLLGAVALSVDYSNLSLKKSRLQELADTAALAGARELRLASSSNGPVIAAAQNYVNANATSVTDSAISFSGVISSDNSSLSITLAATVPTYIASTMGFVNTTVGAKATARLTSGPPTCVIGLDQNQNVTVALDQNARMLANGCSVFSNSTKPSGLSVKNSALLQASYTCTAGGTDGVSGNLIPLPKTDCPIMPDPLATRAQPSANGCDPLKNNIVISVIPFVLFPGVYCGGLRVTNGATVQLLPGEYIMKDGPLRVDNGGTLKGQYVGFYFTGSNASVDFDSTSKIDLGAPKSGTLAGILFFQDRASPTGTAFKINSNNASNLLGTIYLPKGNLQFGGTQPVAQNSPFTIVIAATISLSSGPTMYLNTNYAGTDVPVPENVGSNSGTVALVN